MCIYPLAKRALVKFAQVPIPLLYLCLITLLNYVITSYNKGIDICVTYITDSNTTKNAGIGPIPIQIPGIGTALQNIMDIVHMIRYNYYNLLSGRFSKVMKYIRDAYGGCWCKR